MMEGKFSGEVLQALDTDEDLMSAMARELVQKAGVGESADAVWRQLDRERSKHTGPGAAVDQRREENELQESVPQLAPVGVHRVPPTAQKKRKESLLWPRATTS